MSTATVQLKVPDGASPIEVTGELAGEHFIVHKHPRGLTVRPWRVTHVPSGRGVPGEFWTAEHASKYAEAVAALPGDWSTVDGATAAARELGKPVFDLRDQAHEEDRKAWCNSPLPTWPTDEAGATADAMARYYAMTAQDAYLRSDEVIAEPVKRGDPGYEQHLTDAWRASSAFVGEWAALRLLRAMIEHAPDKANEVAADLWGALESGDSLGEWLWEWLIVDYRIDPDAIAEDRRRREEERKRKKAAREASAAGLATTEEST